MDISMCTGGDCPQKEHCLRFTGVVFGRQDFFGMPPYLNQLNGCDHFLDDRPTQDSIRKQAYLFWEKDGCPNGKDVEYWHKAEAYLLYFRRNNG
jgi:hypothetical protein